MRDRRGLRGPVADPRRTPLDARRPYVVEEGRRGRVVRGLGRACQGLARQQRGDREGGVAREAPELRQRDAAREERVHLGRERAVVASLTAVARRADALGEDQEDARDLVAGGREHGDPGGGGDGRALLREEQAARGERPQLRREAGGGGCDEPHERGDAESGARPGRGRQGASREAGVLEGEGDREEPQRGGEQAHDDGADIGPSDEGTAQDLHVEEGAVVAIDEAVEHDHRGRERGERGAGHAVRGAHREEDEREQDADERADERVRMVGIATRASQGDVDDGELACEHEGERAGLPRESVGGHGVRPS